jgi:small ligand-binding sensory domain FIST
MGPSPDLAVLFVGDRHTGALDDIAAALRTLLGPVVLVGATAPTVIGAGDGLGVALWCGYGFDAEGEHTPAETPVLELGARLRISSVGRVVLDGLVAPTGRVRATFDHPIEVVVSHAVQPLGEPVVVTAAEGSLVLELAGQPALARTQSLLDALDEEDRRRARAGLVLGAAVIETDDVARIDEMVLTDVRGGERTRGAIALSDDVPVGTTVQLAFPDPDAGDRRLRHLLSGYPHEAALVFSTSHRDLGVLLELLPATAVAGVVDVQATAPRAHVTSTVVALF